MAIVNMKKISVIALSDDEKEVVETLMDMGVTQVEDITEEEITAEYAGLLSKRADDEAMSVYDAQRKTVKEAIDILAAHVDAKKVLFAPRRSVSKAMFAEVAGDPKREYAFAQEVTGAVRRQNELRSEKNRLLGEIETLSKWKGLGFSLGFTGTKHTGVLLGMLPAQLDVNDFSTKLSEAGLIAEVQTVSSDKDAAYLAVIYHKSSEGELQRLLPQLGFSTAAVSGDDVPEAVIGQLLERIGVLEGEAEAAVAGLKEMAKDKARLEVLYDYLSECIEKEAAYAKLGRTEHTVLLKGWVPAEAADAVVKTLEGKFVCETELASPTEEEAYPILLRNPKVIQPFESVTEMYSLPAPHSMDPNKLMAPFFFLFFGMMVSDAGYGLLLALITGFIVWKYKPQGQAGKLMKLICYGGVATMFWGVIFGGYFGDTIPVVVKMATGKEIVLPSLVNPSNDPISVLILSLILGLIHLFAGMGAKAYLLIKRGQIWDAVFDIGFWYLVLGGIGILCLGMILPGTPVMQIGMWTAVAGAIGLILTQGRAKKNIFAKLIGGIGSLYDIVGYMSDILSYSRLLALGLSTGVVASVVNMMGSMGGNTVVGWIMFALVFVIGHVFNIAINTLGAYVHASRLQYVEFFGKFYESGGKAFQPLVRPRKYVEVTDEIE